jgi:hypothetical protein
MFHLLNHLAYFDLALGYVLKDAGPWSLAFNIQEETEIYQNLFIAQSHHSISVANGFF